MTVLEDATFRYVPGLLTATAESGRVENFKLARESGRFVERLVAARGKPVADEQMTLYVYQDEEPDYAQGCMTVFANQFKRLLEQHGIRSDYLVRMRAFGWRWAASTEIAASLLLVPPAVEAALRRILDTHADRTSAETVRMAVFGR